MVDASVDAHDITSMPGNGMIRVLARGRAVPRAPGIARGGGGSIASGGSGEWVVDRSAVAVAGGVRGGGSRACAYAARVQAVVAACRSACRTQRVALGVQLESVRRCAAARASRGRALLRLWHEFHGDRRAGRQSRRNCDLPRRRKPFGATQSV
ncbi:hypothetical protein BVI2075_980032 [Burkholderia vietnamiensis]|nr:hypothetical protein BVI2075_980032 [Burkholderia vietnamiensis]